MIEGSFVALITPMNLDGSIDFEGFRTLLQFHEENDTSAVLIMGSTGEVSMLSIEERHAIVRETMKARTGNMQLWYGCTGTTTAGTIEYVAQAASEGADGAIIAAPAYICASNAAIVQFCLEVADVLKFSSASIIIRLVLAPISPTRIYLHWRPTRSS